jgi:hypothetical protein
VSAYGFDSRLNESSNGRSALKVILVNVIDPPCRCPREMRVIDNLISTCRVLHTCPRINYIPSTKRQIPKKVCVEGGKGVGAQTTVLP